MGQRDELKEIDLDPRQWERIGESDKSRANEPFWGDGWPLLPMFLVYIAVLTTITVWWRGY